jgi:ParB family transcriptional regulator, chromosome partitioning protein
MSPEQCVAIGELGEQLARLRLCEPDAVAAMEKSLTHYGQLTAALVFARSDGLEVIDGFKRVQAARRLGWQKLRIRQCAADAVQATVQIAALHAGRGLTQLEEGWIVRALYRDHGLSQPAIAERLARHKSWVCRRLLLVEALDTEAQARVRLGLLSPRAAVALTALPRGNQVAASDVVVQRGLTVRQTELLVGQLRECAGDAARASLLARWASGELAPKSPGRAPSRAMRSDADWLISDVAVLRRVAAKVEARLLAAPLLALGPSAAELVAESLESLAPVLAALQRTIGRVTTPRSRVEPDGKQSAA